MWGEDLVNAFLGCKNMNHSCMWLPKGKLISTPTYFLETTTMFPYYELSSWRYDSS